MKPGAEKSSLHSCCCKVCSSSYEFIRMEYMICNEINTFCKNIVRKQENASPSLQMTNHLLEKQTQLRIRGCVSLWKIYSDCSAFLSVYACIHMCVHTHMCVHAFVCVWYIIQRQPWLLLSFYHVYSGVLFPVIGLRGKHFCFTTPIIQSISSHLIVLWLIHILTGIHVRLNSLLLPSGFVKERKNILMFQAFYVFYFAITWTELWLCDVENVWINSYQIMYFMGIIN